MFDDVTFDRVSSYKQGAHDLHSSLASVTFAGDDTPYYALGTAYVKPEEYEPSKGRILLLAYRCGEGKVALELLWPAAVCAICLPSAYPFPAFSFT